MVDQRDNKWRLAKRAPGNRSEDSWVELELEYDPSLKVGAAGTRRQGDVPRRPGLTPAGWFAGAVVVLAGVALVLNFTLPWIYTGMEFVGTTPTPLVENEPPEDHHRADLLGDASAKYGERLVTWPLAFFIVMVGAGLALLATDLIAGLRSGIHRLLQGLLLSVVAFSGFIVALTGTRWLGQYIVHLMGDTTFDFPGGQITVIFGLHAVPYINLVVGLGVVAGAVFFLKPALEGLFQVHRGGPVFRSKPVRVAALTAAVSAGGLLLMPLLPFASGDMTLFREYVGESTFAVLAQLPEALDGEYAGIGSSLGLVRVMAWIMLYCSIAMFWVAVGVRLWDGPQKVGQVLHVYALGGVPVVLAVVFLVRYYVALGEAEALSVFVNPFLLLLVAGLVGVYGYYLVQVLVPAVQSLRNHRRRSGASV